MPDPKAHQVLWFLGTFVVLWSVSLLVRVVRPERARLGLGDGPGASAWRALVVAVVFSAGVATIVAGSRLRRWVYGADANAREWSVYDAGAAGVFAFAVTLAVWGLVSDRSRGRSRCPGCWYDMGAVGASGRFVCPECGRDAGSAAGLRRTRRRWGLVWTAGAVAALGLVMPRLAGLERGGVKALLPTTLLVPMVWSVPDGWVQASSAEDDWTLEHRLSEGAAWGWQRGWCESKVRAELASPTGVASLHRAVWLADLVWPGLDLPASASTVELAVRGLASARAEDRPRALELLLKMERKLLRGSGPGWEEAFRGARAAVAGSAGSLASALGDEDPEVVFAAAEWLAPSAEHRAAAVSALVARYAEETRARMVERGTQVLLPYCVERAEVAEAIVRKSREAGDEPGSTMRLWDAVRAGAASVELPAAILARADEVLRGTDTGAMVSVARFRLSGRHASPAMLAELLEAAAGRGPRRYPALSALFVSRAAQEPFAGDRAVLVGALEDPEPAVVALACRWIIELSAGPGFRGERYEAGLEAARSRGDRRVRDSARMALDAIAEARAGASPPGR